MFSVFIALMTFAVYGETPAAQPEAPATQPKTIDAKTALAECDRAIAAAKAEYDKKVLAVKAETIKKLTGAMEKATKAGNLDEALAIREQIKELQPKVTVAMQPATPSTDKLTAANVVGTWDVVQPANNNWRARMQFDADGTYHYHSNFGSGSGTWRINDQSVVLTDKDGTLKDTYVAGNGMLVSHAHGEVKNATRATAVPAGK